MAMEPRASLIAKGGPEDGTVTSLGLGVLSIGRSMMSDIVVDQPGISRQHASIRGDAAGFWIADAGSRNGTYLNGQKLDADPVIPQEGDKIELGGMATYWVFASSSMTLDIPTVGMTVTIMFTDIVESTALTERLGDSLARSVLRTHDAIVRRQMHAHNGTEVKALGDGFMITFPSAKSGVDCALAVQRELGEFNSSNPTVQVGVRIGLSVGEPIVEDADLFGHAVNLAARVNELAGAGQIYASEIVQSLLSATGEGNLREVGTFELKGITQPQKIFEIVQP